MNYERYNNISISPDALDYKFVSSGKKGDLEKLIKFNPIPGNTQIYNLALGTIEEDGHIDFLTLSRNGDRDKILATIAAAAYSFSEAYPEKMIFFTGDNPVKTRLYQMAINNAYDEITETFTIHGVKAAGSKFQSVIFEKGINYDGFLFKRKKPDSD